jgi:protein-S-isoprenylcysteine O-methyltransferase Ste14
MVARSEILPISGGLIITKVQALQHHTATSVSQRHPDHTKANTSLFFRIIQYPVRLFLHLNFTTYINTQYGTLISVAPAYLFVVFPVKVCAGSPFNQWD